VQQDRALAEDEWRSDVSQHRSDIVDVDPKFSMIYYDNDQFGGEDIYYLQKERENGIHQLVLHFFAL
jgi:SPX domain protein involved in polyphosphate accumulation